MNFWQRSSRWFQKFWAWDDSSSGFRYVFGRDTSSGESVSPQRALQLVTVWACVSLLADMDAMAPVDVLVKDGSGRVQKVDHRVSELLNWEPNSEMSAFDYHAHNRISEELYGNALVWKVTSSRGTLGELWPLKWPCVETERVGPFNRLIYHYRPGGGMPDKDFGAEEVIHHRTRVTKDGVVGLSPIEQCAEAMGISIATETYGAKWFKNGAMPSLLWVNKGATLSEKAEQNFLDSQRTALAGADNAHKIGLAQGNMELQVVNITPEQSQFLETRRFNQEQIIQIYRIPPHLIGVTEKVTSWGTGIAEQNTAFATYALGPRFVASEKQDRRSLFTREEKRQGIYLKRNIAAILRADIKGRYEAYKTGIETGFTTPNEVRELEDLSPAAGLDHYRFPLNTAYIDEGGNVVNPNGTAISQAEGGGQ